MANSYHKILNHKLKTNYKNKFVEQIHQDMKRSLQDDDDIFSMLENMNIRNRADGFDINVLLKYYMLNQILETSRTRENKNKYIDTSNPNIKTDVKGAFYRVFKDCIEKDTSILRVNSDGSYVVQDVKNNYSLKIQKTYDIADKILSIQVLDNLGKAVANKILAAEFIGLKREYKKKYKYTGYSGNSNDMIATIKNFLSTPIETGYYMDFHCNFYKWQTSTSSFVRMSERDSDSPLLVDIEYCDNGTVIRQEYTGIVA